MVAEKPTGNPVFDFRASFRARADRMQRLLIRGGLAFFCLGGLAGACGWTNPRLRVAAGLACLAGGLFCLLGVAWGFYWRKQVRMEFRKQRH